MVIGLGSLRESSKMDSWRTPPDTRGPREDFRWRPGHGVLKANLLFVFDRDGEEEAPYLILIVEDCFIELCDENKLGKDFTFEIKFKTTGRSFTFAADSFKALERWVSLLTISPIEYINLSKQSFLEQMEHAQKTKNEPSA